TGDAGWAGGVAAALLRGEGPVVLIFQPGMQLLPLVSEAVALLPEDRRWDVTFTTYFTSLPRGVSASLRCVLHDSPEARQAAQLPGATVVDLTQPSGEPPPGSLTEAARTGRG